ncbi:MAG: hypothetical protein OEZ34_00185 [Spirochaetia bacterium]|nr:hypothetical protein [Spirochaetia bacterium]
MVQVTKLSFGATYINHENGIVESSIENGTEITAENVDEIIEFFQSMNPPARLLLADRKNRYSFTFEAIQKIKNVDVVDACAEVHYGRKVWWKMANFITPKYFKLRFFNDKSDAVKWLLEIKKEEEHKVLKQKV